MGFSEGGTGYLHDKNELQKENDHPHVLYETFNEPLQINWQDDLKPYHTDVVNAIRRIDAKNVALPGTPGLGLLNHRRK
ncbi:beta-1,4-endoglucanase [Aphelenchoides avenae]|nr:beta-1,4-endoglucanase [Aphelenchus avenae]